jgi:hypothetical protein
MADRASRVQTFGIQNTADFAAGSKAQTHFTNIDTLLGKLDQAKAGQIPARAGKAVLFQALDLDLVNLARTARQIEKTENGFAAPFRLPDNTSDTALLIHTDAVLAVLEDQPADDAATKAEKAAVRARFIEYEMPADFVAHLRADRDAITDAGKHNEGENLDGVKNTRLIDELLKQINGEVAELDAIMHNKYTGQPEKLAAWISASHVERDPRHKKDDAATTPTAPTA